MISNLIKLALGRWQVTLSILAALCLTHTLAYCQGRSDGRQVERAKWELAAAKAEVRAARASNSAAEQRAADTIANNTAAQERTDAIAQNPDNPRLGLNCQRLRQAGLDTPPACAGR